MIGKGPPTHPPFILVLFLNSKGEEKSGKVSDKMLATFIEESSWLQIRHVQGHGAILQNSEVIRSPIRFFYSGKLPFSDKAKINPHLNTQKCKKYATYSFHKTSCLSETTINLNGKPKKSCKTYQCQSVLKIYTEL